MSDAMPPTPPDPSEPEQPGVPPVPPPPASAPDASYPPPPPGGTPPPPPPPPSSYPPPAPEGHAQQSGGSVDVGKAFSWSWEKFTANASPLVLGLLAYVAILIVAFFVWFLIQGAILNPSINSNGTLNGPSFFFSIFVGALGVLIFAFLSYLIQAGMSRVGLDIASGRPADISRLFSTDRLAKVIVAGIIVAVATFIGTLLCYLPGLIVAFFCQYFVLFILDKDLEPIDSIKASVSFVMANFLPLLLVYIVCAVIVFVGAILCGVGLLVAIPLAVLIQVYAFRTLQNEPVAA